MFTSPHIAAKPSLSLEGISKRYGPTTVLDQVNLSLGQGEVVALMGANGAGKSTLAKIASGVVRPDAGRIFVNGEEVRLSSPRTARARGIVIVYQSTDQLGIPGLSVAENLLLDELCDGRLGVLAGSRKLLNRAKTVAAGIDLDLAFDRDFAELGPAHRQLIAIARAVAANAAVMIFDEPTASLAAAEASRLFAVIDRLRARGVGILYISHRLADIRRLADRIVVLRNGQVVLNQAHSLDLSVAIRAMIGRDFDKFDSARADLQNGEPLLQLKQVRLTRASKPFDLSVKAGEIVAITGALGSGKSRLLGALFGLSQVTDGKILLGDRPWHPKGPDDAIAAGVFMAGEDRWRSSLLPAITPGADIAGTIALPHRRRWFPFGLVRPNREETASREVIKALGIRCRNSRDTLDLLSGGNQQKVVVGRWQVAPRRLLLLDEPFQGIDVGSRRDLIAAIRSRRHDSVTLIATSDVEEALEVADMVAVMRNQTLAGLYDMRISDSSSLLAAITAVEADESDELMTMAT
jgi:simple sugar transport system ATP-binding protein